MALTTEEMGELLDLLTKADDRQLRLAAEQMNDCFKIAQRRRAREVALELEVGSEVRIISGIKPKYLAGKTGTVTKLEGPRVTVKLDCGPINKFYTGSVTFRSASALEVI